MGSSVTLDDIGAKIPLGDMQFHRSTIADLLAGVLSLPTLLRPQVADEVLMSLSVGHRTDTGKAAASARAASGYLSEQLSQVTVDAPDAVTLSSESGNLGAEVVNGLDQAVTVKVALQSDDGSLEMEDLGEIEISAGARHRILPSVTANRPGIHQVGLVVTDAGLDALEQLGRDRAAFLQRVTTDWDRTDLTDFSGLLGRFLDDLAAALPGDAAATPLPGVLR